MEGKNEAAPLTKVVDISKMPEEFKATINEYPEPKIKTVLELGEYIYLNKQSIPLELLKLTEEKNSTENLNFKHIRLSQVAFKHLSVIIYFLKQAKTAIFHDMQIGPESMKILSPGIGQLVNLTEISLASNPIGSGAKYLGQSLKNLTKLEILDLTDCSLGPSDFSELCLGLSCIKYLFVLKISMNPIGDLGCRELAKTIIGIPLILQIELFTCEITDEGARFLVDSFKQLNLESVMLGNNKISKKMQGKIKGDFPYVHFGIKYHSCVIY